MIRRIVNWFRPAANRFAATIVFLALIFASSMAFYVNEQQDAKGCRHARENRDVIRDVVILATAPSGSVSIDFSAIEGFDAMDAETQAYMLALGELLESNPGGRSADRRAELLSVIPEIEC